jgi:hypothetical protein
VIAIGNLTVDGSRAGAGGPRLSLLAPNGNGTIIQGTTEDMGKLQFTQKYQGTTYPPAAFIGGFPPDIRGGDHIGFSSGLGLEPLDSTTTSPATNWGSHAINYGVWTWDGSQKQKRFWYSMVQAGLSGNNAPSEYQLRAQNAAGANYNYSYPTTVWGVNDVGVLRLGQENANTMAPKMASIDPTALTSNQTFTLPNAGGQLAVLTTGTAAPATTPAAVGLLYLDTANAKLYVSKGTASSADWIALN